MRSIGESTQRPAKATATFARRGTRGSFRRRRIAVTHAGRKPAISFRTPGGSRRARTTSSSHEARMTAAPTTMASSDAASMGHQ
jgi:hypothetical protein